MTFLLMRISNLHVNMIFSLKSLRVAGNTNEKKRRVQRVKHRSVSFLSQRNTRVPFRVLHH